MEKENNERSDYSNMYLPFGSNPAYYPSQYRQITGSSLPPSRTWTELMGATVEEAQNKIKEDMPEAQIVVLVPPYALSQDFRYYRVRILVDSYGKVEQAPEVG